MTFGLPDFRLGMTIDTPFFVCVNVGSRMCGTQPIYGQLWTQEDRRFTVTNGCLPYMGTSREEVCLSGIADVLSWRHTVEVVDYHSHPDCKRPSQRVIVYSKFLHKLDSVLATGNVGMDSESSRWDGPDTADDMGGPLSPNHDCVPNSHAGPNSHAIHKSGWRTP
jgi:hypothetical protein